ncbi:unnamed protein product [Pedinophyceae sp. YPF-701]|nr:unnamed protein product [Pedinophyceae sp. YPF-701]
MPAGQQQAPTDRVQHGPPPTLFVAKTPSPDLVVGNRVYLHASDYAVYRRHARIGPEDPLYLELAWGAKTPCVFTAEAHDECRVGTVAVNTLQRQSLGANHGEELSVRHWGRPHASDAAAACRIEVGRIGGAAVPFEVSAEELTRAVVEKIERQWVTVGQLFVSEVQGLKLSLRVVNVMSQGEAAELAKGGGKPGAGDEGTSLRGVITRDSKLFYEVPDTASRITITGQASQMQLMLLRGEGFANLERLGIGGLDEQFSMIFRRTFASRVFPPDVMEKMGIKHVKGMLLFGPPGTGKTLVARQIGQLLGAVEPKIVNGPEVLNKYVGQSEENIRNLFSDAEADEKAKGANSPLHVIIFDEIDAICKARGSVRDGSGVHDTVVNQLLTKIDGVNALNNILLIGMTNRKDMLDEALLRPGRMEVQVEIGLPDERGRLQILNIHTQKMSGSNFLGDDVDLDALAARTKNFSGAEIEGLVKSAASWALNRHVDTADLEHVDAIDMEAIRVTMGDFERALNEVKAAFGVSGESLQSCMERGIIRYGPRFVHMEASISSLVNQTRESENTSILTCLIQGPPGSGKTALAAKAALDSGFPFVKLVSPNDVVGFSEHAKASFLAKAFDDAHRSPVSALIVDDIERLLEYVAIGPRFSNFVLQTLLVLLKKKPPPGRRLLVIGTTSMEAVLDAMEVTSAFNVVLRAHNLSTDDAARVLVAEGAFPEAEAERAAAMLGDSVPIKRLLLLVEMARHAHGGKGGGRVPMSQWERCISDLAG